MQAGLGAAAKLAAELDEQSQREATAASAGRRPPLPQRTPPPEAAAEALLAADEMLTANPDLQAARAARVEVHTNRTVLLVWTRHSVG